MITYAEVKSSPPWGEEMPNANEPVKTIELALAELIDSYRGKISQEAAVAALQAQLDRVSDDWEAPAPAPDAQPEPPDETAA